MTKKIFGLLCLLGLCSGGLFAQLQIESRQISIKRAEGKVKVDGVLDDEDWQSAQVEGDFFLRFPNDNRRMNAKTEVRMTYDDDFLYISTVCIDPEPGPYVIESRRRDFNTFGALDFISVIIDPFQDQTNGFEFTLNPYNVQREALISNGGSGRNSTSSSWDNIWYSKTRRLEDRWVAEIAIPFKTIRYKEGSPRWRINFVRHDSKQNERGNWSWIPRNFRQYNLANTGFLNWDRPPKKPKANIAVIPYLTGSLTKDYEDDTPINRKGGIGGDAKIGLGPGLNLDLTFNPDFSQVEVDRQVTNLDRFEINFPERRQFFLENNDLFTDFGSSSLRPFFTRRIGIARDKDDRTVQNRILYGARLSGKTTERMRVGLLNMQTESDEDLGINSTNYTVGVVQQQVFKRSNISAIFVNKHEFAPDFQADSALVVGDSTNQIAGIDYNLASADGVWSGKLFYHHSFDNRSTVRNKAFSQGASLRYDVPNWEISWNHEIVGKDYDAEVGFIRRTGYNRIRPGVERSFYPKSKLINRISFEVTLDALWSHGLGLTDRLIEANTSFRLNTGDFIRFQYERDFVYLTNDFDPTRTDDILLLEGSSYNTNRLTFFYFSDSRRKVTGRIFGGIGQYFNGTRANIQGEAGLRIQPFGRVSLDFTYNRIKLPDDDQDREITTNLLLLGPKLDLTLTNKIFFSTLVQYNNQAERFNVNARFQWRFKPASDLFIVYTDDYNLTDSNLFNPNAYQVRNRGIVFKLTYWLNI